MAQWWRICLQCRRHMFDHWAGKIPLRRKWQPIPVFLPGKSRRQRSLVGYSPGGHIGVRPNSVTKTEAITFLFTSLKIYFFSQIDFIKLSNYNTLKLFYYYVNQILYIYINCHLNNIFIYCYNYIF